MSPQMTHPEIEDNDVMGGAARLSDMRRVSLSLAFSPARQNRRRPMSVAGNWLQSRLGVHRRRSR